jgi:hypothetical protein
MSEYQQEEARKRAQSCYCQSLFRKDTTDFKPGVLAPEVYQFDRDHTTEEALGMRLEALASLNEVDYPSVEPVREALEEILRYQTDEEKTTYLIEEKRILREKVTEFYEEKQDFHLER